MRSVIEHCVCFAGSLRRRPVFRIVLFTVVCSAGALAVFGCRSGGAGAASSKPSLSGNAQAYPIKGIVVSLNPAADEVTIDTEAIPGFMGAMIMPYKLANPRDAQELHAGDHVTGRLRVSNSGSLLDRIVVTAQARPSYKPAVVYNVLKRGETVPNFHFLNQNGKVIDIADFRGKVLVMTFIYTRCPLPDYCIRMSRNFAKIDQALAATPEIYGETHLLSVSFDPTHDTPAVLRNYGRIYTGKKGKGAFAHWDFAAAPEAELKPVDAFFDVSVTPGPNQTLNHSLATVVIGPEGKILNSYLGNDWTPEQVLKDINQALPAA